MSHEVYGKQTHCVTFLIFSSSTVSLAFFSQSSSWNSSAISWNSLWVSISMVWPDLWLRESEDLLISSGGVNVPITNNTLKYVWLLGWDLVRLIMLVNNGLKQFLIAQNTVIDWQWKYFDSCLLCSLQFSLPILGARYIHNENELHTENWIESDPGSGVPGSKVSDIVKGCACKKSITKRLYYLPSLHRKPLVQFCYVSIGEQV